MLRNIVDVSFGLGVIAIELKGQRSPQWSTGASKLTSILLCHSVLGLRDMELRAADLLRSAGHTVVTPDMFAGLVATSLNDGFAIVQRIGWDSICARAHESLAALPDDAALAGISMGAGVVSTLWPTRPAAAGGVLLHGLASPPANVRPRFPVQVHIAEGDRFASASAVAAWRAEAEALAVCSKVYSYRNAGHFFTDASLADYNEQATREVWARVLRFLHGLTTSCTSAKK